MNHLSPGLISAYNSLTDKHLAGYFSNTRIRRHLQRAGLITRSGRIVPDKEYRHKLIQRAHQRHVRECLAQAIFHKVLEMERVHQIEIKRKLEEFARRERVHKIKVERSKRYEEDVIHILSPRPPTAARGVPKQHSGPEGEHSESSESPGSSRPNTAPGTMQRPVRLKPIHSNATTASLRRSSPYRRLESSNENDQPFNCTIEKQPRRRLTKTEASGGISPYCLPVINNFVTPVPPATKRKERGVKVTPSGALRGRRLRPTTASSGADDPPMLRSSVHQSRVCVNMVYFGRTVHLSHNLADMRDEVKVLQQHCGGENLCVFKGKLHEGETFQFISRRHRGFPFSLTFFLNGLQVERLSSCCEFKHRKGSRLGGRHGYFGFCSVERASPCYKCIIAMGLDKKPSPPLKRVKESREGEDSVISPKDAAEVETERTADDSERETRQAQSMETRVKEETAAEEDKVRDDYEEDFEADDEGPAEDTEAKGKMCSTETERQVKERDTPEAEDVEKDEEVKSRSGSCSSGSDREESDAETQSREDEEAEQLKEVDQEETAAPPDEKNNEPSAEEAAVTEAEPAAPKDSDIQDIAGDSTEIDVLDTSVPSGKENKLSDYSSGEKTGDESKQEEEQERAKSVQEKLAEAILKESQCSSEPELSDTSTEEEEESMDKGPGQDSKDVAVGKSVMFTEQQQTIEEEGVADEADVAQYDEETSESKEQEDKTEKEPHENRDGPENEKVTIGEEDQKAASEEDKNTAENDESENTEAALHPVSEQEMTGDDKEPQEEAAAKSAEKDEENEEKTAAEADETGQEAKSSEEDESSVSELNQKTDETAAADNVEEEATTASETMEMKAEPSEERQALNYEETPVTDIEKQEDSEDRDTASETEDKAENSSSSLEGSGDTTVEKIANISEDKDESSKDDIKEEENQQERDDLEVEQPEKPSIEIDDREETCEKESKEEQKTHPDEITEGEKRAEKDDKDKTEEEKNNESKTEESIENISEEDKNNSNTGGKANEEQAEEDNVENEEKENESEKTERDEGNECVEEMKATTDKTTEGEQIDTAADEEKHDEAEKEERDQTEDKAEKFNEKNKDDEETEEKLIDTGKTANGEEISKITEESGKSADAELDEDGKIFDKNIAESEDVAESEAANVETAEETPHTTVESEDVQKGPEAGSENSEKGEVDVENGEISPAAKNKTPEDEGEVQTEGEDDVKTAEDNEDGRKTEEPLKCESAEEKEVTVEPGDGNEKHEDNKVNEFPETEALQSDVKEPDDSVEKQDEPTANVSEPDTSGAKEKEDSEGTKQDENGNISDPHNDSDGSDVMKKSDKVWSNVGEVKVASSGDQTSTAVDSDDTVHELNESVEPSDSKSDKHPLNAAAADLPAVDGDNRADTEEASKASEEGASVLLQPQAELSQNKERTEESAAGSPEALATEDNTDLVTNWVTMHQTSRFFETFVEPLEDLKESTSEVSNSKEEATQSVEPPRLASPPKASENIQESTANDLKNKEDAVVWGVESSQSGAGEVEEEAEVEDLILETQSEQKDSVTGPDIRLEQLKGTLHEDKTQEGLVQDRSEQTVVSKTEVESLAGTHHSVTSRRPESVSENQTNNPDSEKQRASEEVTGLQPSSETPDHRECLTSPDELSKLKYTWRKSDEQSREVTEISEFTTSMSDDGSQEECHREDVQPKRSAASVNGDRRDMQLIQDIKHTVSRERLSTFSVDETLLGQSSFPLLTAARTESGH